MAIVVIAVEGRAGEPAPEPSRQQRIDRLIEQLGDDQYDVREHAQDELAKLGFDAFDALTVAENHKDLEIAARARYLLRLLQVDLVDKNDPPDVAACLENYPFLPMREQQTRMRRLAALPEGQGIPALCRLVRFERSTVRSKHAAVEILRRKSSEKPDRAGLAKLLRDHLQHSRRPASRWLLVWAGYTDNPQAALAEWKEAIHQEEAALDGDNPDTDREIISALVLQQIQWVSASGNNPAEVADAMRTLLRLSAGDHEAVAALVDWVVEQKAWEVMALEPGALAEQFARDPKTLLYHLAKAYETAGKAELAEAAAQKALGLEIPAGINPQLSHARAGYMLQREGLFKWSEREYREVIESGGLAAPFVLDAYSRLSEMLHDQGDDLRAAEVARELADRLKKETVADEETTKELAKTYDARANFLFASHWATAGDRGKQREFLDRALEADPTEVDVLIACYHLPDAPAEYREKIRELVKKAVAGMRRELLTSPDKAMAYNQLAWLVSNTEGDFDEAIRLSQKSLQMSRNNGGYLDTLARCYFAKGDYEKAVEYQTKATELEPHSGQIVRQLRLFRKTYEEKTGKPAPEQKPPPDAKKPGDDADLEEEEEPGMDDPFS